MNMMWHARTGRRRSHAAVRCSIIVAALAAPTLSIGCRQYDSNSPAPKGYQVPKDPSDAAARRRLMPGMRAGMTTQAQKVEQDLGY
jgi:hypothetical protein